VNVLGIKIQHDENGDSQMNARSAMYQYQQIGVHSAVMDATPHRLVQMLLEGVLEKVSLAKGNIARNETAKKGENISKAITIVGGLHASLNKEVGGELSENLGNLYDYMSRRLVIANLRSDPGILDEIANLVLEVKAGWDAIPDLLGN
jgi:flagellar secretion chaperone FliS